MNLNDIIYLSLLVLVSTFFFDLISISLLTSETSFSLQFLLGLLLLGFDFREANLFSPFEFSTDEFP